MTASTTPPPAAAGQEEDGGDRPPRPLLLSPLHLRRLGPDEGGGDGGGGGGQGGRYRTLRRVVAPAPWAGDGCDGDPRDDDRWCLDGADAGGEVEAAIEEYYPPPSTGPAAAAAAAPPLFRRVAVRSYGGGGDDGGGGGGGGAGGILHASYELPPLALTTVRFRGGGTASTTTTPEETEEGSALDPILCWAGFRDRRRHGRRRGRRKRPPSAAAAEAAGGRRKMLCALAGPSLLRIFDVYPPRPDGECDGDGGGGDGGEGYAVPLPFEARSIHPLPNDAGLLIQRAPAAEDEAAAAAAAAAAFVGRAAGRERPEGADATADGGDGRDVDSRGSRGGNDGGDDDDGEGGPALHGPPDPIRLRSPAPPLPGALPDAFADDDDGGGTAAAAGPDAPDPGWGFGVGGGGGVGGEGGVPSLFALSHPLDEIRPVATTAAAAAARTPNLPWEGGAAAAAAVADARLPPPVPALRGGSEDGSDDVDVDEDAGGEAAAAAAPPPPPGLLAPFSDAMERVVFVGGPRIFAMPPPLPPPPPSSPQTSGGRGAGGGGGGEEEGGGWDVEREEEEEDDDDDDEREEEDDPVVMVTYHELLGRHAVWSVRAAPPPPPPPPLWRRTAGAAGSRRPEAGGSGDGDGDGEGAPVSPLRDDDAAFAGGRGSEDDGARGGEVARGGGLPADNDEDYSPFGDIHPDWRLVPLYAEEAARRNIADDEEEEGEDRSARAAFLATDVGGTGDLALCLLRLAVGGGGGGDGDGDGTGGPSNAEEEENVLQTISLRAAYAAAGRRGSSFAIVVDAAEPSPPGSDVPCRSARPVLSAPAPPPPGGSDRRGRLLRGRRLRGGGGGGRIARTTTARPRAREVLLCSASGALRLRRAGAPVAECALPPGGVDGRARGLANAAHDRLDILREADEGSAGDRRRRGAVVVRAALSRSLAPLSPVAEAALTAVESALCHGGVVGAADRSREARLALLVRSDCARLAQALSFSSADGEGEENGVPLEEDAGWSAVMAVLSSLFDEALSSLSIGDANTSGCAPVTEEDEDPSSGSAWQELLLSDFHANYVLDEGQSLLLERSHSVDSVVLRPSSHHDKRGEAARRALEALVPSSLSYFARTVESPEERAKLNAIRAAQHLKPTASLPFSSVVARAIFDSLHLLYEDSKLSRNARGMAWMRPLGTLLTRLCMRIGFAHSSSSAHGGPGILAMGDFVDHYCRDLGCDLLEKWTQGEHGNDSSAGPVLVAESMIPLVTSFEAPPCFFSWIDGMIKGYYPLAEEEGYRSGCDYPQNGDYYAQISRNELNGTCSMTGLVHRFFSILFTEVETTDHIMQGDQVKPSDDETDEMDVELLVGTEGWLKADSTKDRSLVLAMVEEGISHPSILLDEFPSGVALPLMEALNRCRSDPPLASAMDSASWPASAYILINRSDIAETFRNGAMYRAPFSVQGAAVFAPKPQSQTQNREDPDRDGLVPLESASSMLFPEDNRVREAVRLLRSSRPIFLRVPRAPEVSDHDYERLKQERLLLLCRRVLALPLGRGMATIGTLPPTTVTTAAEPLPMPDLCLSGRVPPTNATLALDISGCPADMNVWPEFHNGAAAGLRLPLAREGHENDGLRQITRTWIVYNKPTVTSQARQSSNNTGEGASDGAERPNHAHGGFLMALGLRGHLAALAMTDIYDYLTQGAVTTTIGILLGMAANKRGTCDPSVSKMLCLHLPSLLPPSFAAMDVASTAQSAAVAGIGLLYQSSSHRLMTEFLLNELGKRPSTDQNTQDRQGYTLCCGLALGMVNLSTSQSRGSDDDGCGLSDLRLEERLLKYVVGGLDDMDSRQRREAAERASTSGNANSAEQERCSCIHEGESINTDVTAPGATLALGLMHMKTGNKSVASRLALPDTLFMLDYVRPDLLMLRVITRALILWDDVKPTKQWIETQIPSVVAKRFVQMGKKAEQAAGYSIGLANFTAMQMDVDPSNEQTKEDSSDREEDTSTSEARGNEEGNANFGRSDDGNTTIDAAVADDFDFDRQAVRQAHAHIVSGACFGMGLRFAGTGDPNAAAALREQVNEFLRLREENDLVSAAQRPERPILEMCLGSSVIALAMVMAGTGDLETLRLCRALRWTCEDDIRYGTHMNFAAAIGLLFLGGGTCTLGREPEDIAALLLAFFPRFPSTTSDNQYHLQALRHCYALAVKHRQLEAIDIDTRERVFVPIEVSFEGTSERKMPNAETKTVKLTAPCLLLDRGGVSKVKVVSDRYYPATLDLQSQSFVLFVKKKSGHLSYQQDPHAQRSLKVQTGGTSGGSALDLIQSFTEDPRLLAYAKHLCQGKAVKGANKIMAAVPYGLGISLEDFCTEILHECLTQDKLEALPLYLSLRNSLVSMKETSCNSDGVWNIRLVRSYYQAMYSSGELLDRDFVALLEENMEKMLFESRGVNESALADYVNSCGNWARGNGWPSALGAFLIWHQVLHPSAYVCNSI